MVQVITLKGNVRDEWVHPYAVQAVPNEDWIYLYDEAGQICAMYFSANVLSIRLYDGSAKAGEQIMTDENSNKAGG